MILKKKKSNDGDWKSIGVRLMELQLPIVEGSQGMIVKEMGEGGPDNNLSLR